MDLIGIRKDITTITIRLFVDLKRSNMCTFVELKNKINGLFVNIMMIVVYFVLGYGIDLYFTFVYFFTS